MTLSNRTAAMLLAASLSTIAFTPVMAASDHASQQPACSQSDTAGGVDCTITNSTGISDKQAAPKSDKYPTGPVNMGSGIWF